MVADLEQRTALAGMMVLVVVPGLVVQDFFRMTGRLHIIQVCTLTVTVTVINRVWLCQATEVPGMEVHEGCLQVTGTLLRS